MTHLTRFETLETDVLAALGEAEGAGLGSAAGRAAFERGIAALDTLDAYRGSQIYSPLAADPLTRDYVAHLDGQLHGLSARIDILRAHVELGLLGGVGDTRLLDASLARLIRQVQVRFRREAALVPVFADWCERRPAGSQTAAH
jgi:hypothetical protein